MSSAMLTLTSDQVEANLDICSMVDVLTAAFVNFSKEQDGGVDQPVRTVVSIQNPKGNPEQPAFFGAMPVYSKYDDALACKLVSVYPGNSACGKPTHMANIFLYDPAFGELKAIMDGDFITAMRTAGASAVATKILLKNPESPMKLAIVGAGVQARSHAKVFREIFNVSEISIWSRTMSSALECADEIDATACLSVEEAVSDADVIVTATFTTTPILKKSWVKEGAHINVVGACRPDSSEIAPDLMCSSVVYVDTKDAAQKESGDIILAKADIYAEIGEVIGGFKEIKRTPITIFKSLGMGLEDAVTAKLVYDSYLNSLSSNS